MQTDLTDGTYDYKQANLKQIGKTLVENFQLYFIFTNHNKRYIYLHKYRQKYKYLLEMIKQNMTMIKYESLAKKLTII